MDLDIRAHIKRNFENSNNKEIKQSIISSIKEKDEITLPGLGVFFELMWNNLDKNYQNDIIKAIEKGLK